MRISSNSFTMDLNQFYQKNQTSGTQPKSFDDLLRAAKSDVQNAAASGVVEGHFVNPNMQIISDYERWKSQQPERVLPDSQGATEENLAYLLENFSGELSLFQRMEAVDTMREMGIITEKQMYEAFGLDFTLVKAPKGNIIATEPESGRNMEALCSSFSEHPLMDVRYLDEIFEILDRLLREDTEEDLANDLQEAFDRAKQEIQVFQGFQE